MKIRVMLLLSCPLLLALGAVLAKPPLYVFETQRAVTPFRDAPVSKSACEAQLQSFARDEAKLAHLGEPMRARCVPVND